VIRPGYWRWLLAVGLGTFLGLMAAQWLSGLEFAQAQEDALLLSCEIAQQDTYDFRNLNFFSLKCKDGQSTLTIDGDLPLAQWLRRHRGERIDLDLRPRTLQKVER